MKDNLQQVKDFILSENINPKLPFNHIMVDIETLGTLPGSVILSIGAVAFNMETGATYHEVFYNTISIQSCLNAGLKVESGTLEWWFNQSDEARQKAISEPKHDLHTALYNLRQFIASFGEDVQVWGNSARFDLGLLEAAYKACGVSLPWQFWNERCLRTLVAFAPEIKKNEPFIGTAHSPIEDCHHQIKYASKTWRELKYANS